jgi:hypothetical protein
MKRSWDLKPNLLDCILEMRIVPAPITNLGVIALTTNGFSLVTPFPGASNNASGSGGSSNTAASVSGAAMPTSFYVTGRSGISSFSPGNFTGNPAVGGGGATSANGLSISIQIGSGSDDASASSGASSSAASSSRGNPGYNGAIASTLAYIGGVPSSSTSSSDTSSGSGSQSQQSAPVPPAPSLGLQIPGSPSGTTQGSGMPMNPQLGAPRLIRGLGTSLMPSLPGGLGVGSLTSPTGPGGY